MRIGILTLPLHTNYGGILQAYALQTVLERMGHNVVVFDTDKHWSLPLWKAPLSYGKRILKNLLGRKSVIFAERKANREYPIISKNTQQFIDKYIHRLVVNDLNTLQEKDFDAIVVGSDQIWRAIYYPKIENAYLKFAEHWNIKRITYAASFGTDNLDEYTHKQIQRCGRLIKRFNAVSVREKSGVDLCKIHFGIDAKHVLDPTMLLEAEDYIKLFNDANIPKSKGTLLTYILDETEEEEQLIEQIAQERKLISFRGNSKVEDSKAKIEERIQPPVEQWLRGFYDADYVVTDSFHACVFSILFKKQFVVYGNKGRGMARFLSLLSMFGLESRLITSVEEYKQLPEIDYNKVYNLLNEQKEISMSYLKNALNNE